MHSISHMGFFNACLYSASLKNFSSLLPSDTGKVNIPSGALAFTFYDREMPRLYAVPFIGAPLGQDNYVVYVGYIGIALGAVPGLALVFDGNCPAMSVGSFGAGVGFGIDCCDGIDFGYNQF